MRRLMRWDLHERSLYSCSVVYDCTMIARGHAYQNAVFGMREELEGKFENFEFLTCNFTFLF